MKKLLLGIVVLCALLSGWHALPFHQERRQAAEVVAILHDVTRRVQIDIGRFNAPERLDARALLQQVRRDVDAAEAASLRLVEVTAPLAPAAKAFGLAYAEASTAALRDLSKLLRKQVALEAALRYASAPMAEPEAAYAAESLRVASARARADHAEWHAARTAFEEALDALLALADQAPALIPQRVLLQRATVEAMALQPRRLG